MWIILWYLVSVFLAMVIELGTNFQLFPGMHHKAHLKIIAKKVGTAHVNVSEIVKRASAEVVCDNADDNEDDISSNDCPLDVMISFDGSYHRRGLTCCIQPSNNLKLFQTSYIRTETSMTDKGNFQVKNQKATKALDLFYKA